MGMTRVIITTTCQATVTEEWTMDVDDVLLAEVRTDDNPGAALMALVDGEHEPDAVLVEVNNVDVRGEHDRVGKDIRIVSQ